MKKTIALFIIICTIISGLNVFAEDKIYFHAENKNDYMTLFLKVGNNSPTFEDAVTDGVACVKEVMDSSGYGSFDFYVPDYKALDSGSIVVEVGVLNDSQKPIDWLRLDTNTGKVICPQMIEGSYAVQTQKAISNTQWNNLKFVIDVASKAVTVTNNGDKIYSGTTDFLTSNFNAIRLYPWGSAGDIVYLKDYKAYYTAESFIEPPKDEVLFEAKNKDDINNISNGTNAGIKATDCDNLFGIKESFRLIPETLWSGHDLNYGQFQYNWSGSSSTKTGYLLISAKILPDENLSQVKLCTDKSMTLSGNLVGFLDTKQWNNLNVLFNASDRTTNVYINGESLFGWRKVDFGNNGCSIIRMYLEAPEGKGINISDYSIKYLSSLPTGSETKPPYIDAPDAALDGNTVYVSSKPISGKLSSNAEKDIVYSDRSLTDVKTSGNYENGNVVYLENKGGVSVYNICTDAKIFTEKTPNDEIRAYTLKKGGKIIIASYNSDFRLIGADLSDTNEVSIPIKGSSYIKAFLLGDLSAIKPSASSVIIDTRKYNNPTIACWGDSLTYGQGSTSAGTGNPNDTSYPAVLSKLSGATVYNMGVGGETAETIAARQGAVDILIKKAVTIPRSGSVEIEIEGSDGGNIVPRDVTKGGWNPCSINGVKGRLDVTVDTTKWPRTLSSAKFTRAEEGEEKAVSAGDKLITSAADTIGDINIIFTGTNYGWSSSDAVGKAIFTDDAEINSLIRIIKSQAQRSNNPDKYVVIGLTAWGEDDLSYLDRKMEDAFGEHFLNLRKIISDNQTLLNHNITPTEADIEDISNGNIPSSLITDGTHFNNIGYSIVAEVVYDKLIELGYIN